jgi:D-glycero-alpha-D-manno-heptose-7-phosphate kinase
MIISQTPLRMSFVGGGSDLPAFYERSGGAVVSTAINKYVYVTVNKKFDRSIRVSYSKTEEVETVAQLEHKVVRACLSKLAIDGGVEITSIADIPSRGTGLGSSSSFTVGLLHALHAYQGRYVSCNDLGREGCEIEIDICGERIGKQDQYAAAFGGLNFMRFERDGSVIVEPIICSREIIDELERSMLVLYTGVARSASAILSNQSQEIRDNQSAQTTLRKMVRLAYELRDELRANHLNAFGEILHENWLLKKAITNGITNPQIDDWYERARSAGAIGGKLLGAGGGGFLMFHAPPEKHAAIQESLSELRRVDVRLDNRGSRIILYHNS